MLQLGLLFRHLKSVLRIYQWKELCMLEVDRFLLVFISPSMLSRSFFFRMILSDLIVYVFFTLFQCVHSLVLMFICFFPRLSVLGLFHRAPSKKIVIQILINFSGIVKPSRGKTNHRNGLAALELKGMDRVGLLSEVFAVLPEFQCDVVQATVYTHNGRTASLFDVQDCTSGTSIEDSQKFNRLEARLRSVLQGDSDIRSAKTSISYVVIHPERRLHQMMFADRDYQKTPILTFISETPLVTVQNWAERSYSVVNVQCKQSTDGALKKLPIISVSFDIFRRNVILGYHPSTDGALKKLQLLKLCRYNI